LKGWIVAIVSTRHSPENMWKSRW